MSIHLFLLALIVASGASQRVTLESKEHVPQGWSLLSKRNGKLKLFGRSHPSADPLRDGDPEIKLTFALKQRNLDKLDALFWDVSNPESPQYGESSCCLDEIFTSH